MAPNWGALNVEREPRKFPVGVLVALTMTASRGDVLIPYLLLKVNLFTIHNISENHLFS
jgi:hypothetical protein